MAAIYSTQQFMAPQQSSQSAAVTAAMAKAKADAEKKAKAKALADAEKAKKKAAEEAQKQKQTVGAQNKADNYAGQAVAAAYRAPEQMQAAQIAQTPQARDEYMRALAMAQSAAEGRAPSMAQLQMKQGLDQAARQGLAMARSGRGNYNPALQRAALTQQGVMAQQGAQQSAMLRAQEMAQARSEYGGLSGNLLSSDQQRAMAQAQLMQQAALANQDAGAQQRAMLVNTLSGVSGQFGQQAMGYRGQDLGMSQAQAQLAMQKQIANQQATTARENSQRELIGGLASGAMGAAAKAFAA